MKNEITTLNFNSDQIALIKEQVAPEATDMELQLLLHQANRAGLDPLTRQIFAIHRNTKKNGQWVKKMTIQTSIDGFRVIAERSGNYAGQDKPIFHEENGKIISCEVSVYKFRGDNRYLAAVGIAYWSEFCPRAGQDAMWLKMPRIMLAKVAEALALRKAFPQDLSGIYTDDEIKDDEKVATKPPAPKITPDQVKQLEEALEASGKDKIAFCQLAKINSLADLAASRFEGAIKAINKQENANS